MTLARGRVKVTPAKLGFVWWVFQLGLGENRGPSLGPEGAKRPEGLARAPGFHLTLTETPTKRNPSFADASP